ncbi:hypothetical protein O9G_003509 [Rozella allomycis CSF55]|uniref:Uncharacterized protein n=1 Tax=Rozella allomycis (strain CSF55) TaxID=988480 RepID=A0A075ATJ4_ROZAC|nr:hypothetical protein O9G_003509 [Rozella allomycis CSF55]|eukprot:EPZ32045.1 hypothetical protein O9G_003509 [Rozella allomycis CSF55]
MPMAVPSIGRLHVGSARLLSQTSSPMNPQLSRTMLTGFLQKQQGTNNANLLATNADGIPKVDTGVTGAFDKEMLRGAFQKSQIETPIKNDNDQIDKRNHRYEKTLEITSYGDQKKLDMDKIMQTFKDQGSKSKSETDQNTKTDTTQNEKLKSFDQHKKIPKSAKTQREKSGSERLFNIVRNPTLEPKMTVEPNNSLAKKKYTVIYDNKEYKLLMDDLISMSRNFQYLLEIGKEIDEIFIFGVDQPPGALKTSKNLALSRKLGFGYDHVDKIIEDRALLREQKKQQLFEQATKEAILYARRLKKRKKKEKQRLRKAEKNQIVEKESSVTNEIEQVNQAVEVEAEHLPSLPEVHISEENFKIGLPKGLNPPILNKLVPLKAESIVEALKQLSKEASEYLSWRCKFEPQEHMMKISLELDLIEWIMKYEDKIGSQNIGQDIHVLVDYIDNFISSQYKLHMEEQEKINVIMTLTDEMIESRNCKSAQVNLIKSKDNYKLLVPFGSTCGLIAIEVPGDEEAPSQDFANMKSFWEFVLDCMEYIENKCSSRVLYLIMHSGRRVNETRRCAFSNMHVHFLLSPEAHKIEAFRDLNTEYDFNRLESIQRLQMYTAKFSRIAVKKEIEKLESKINAINLEIGDVRYEIIDSFTEVYSHLKIQ